MLRALLACVAILIHAGCTNHTALSGELGPAAEQLLGSGPYSGCTMRHDGLRGCWTNAGDTISYMYQDETGRVLALGQYWRVAPTNANAVFDSLAAELNTSHAGVTVRNCDRENSGWTVRDRRWTEASSRSVLVLATPKVDLQVLPYIQRVIQIGLADCERLHPLPLPR